MNNKETIENSLATDLQDFKTAWNAKADNNLIQKFENGIEELNVSGMTATALNVGDKAPDFELNNALGNPVKLASLLENGPVIITWYRGGWCPYCNIQLRHLQKFLPEFKEAGATLVALSPELPDKSLNTVEKNELQFEVLTDFNNEVARKFGIAFTLNDELVDIYNDFHKLETYNGVDTNELPIPATYVIDKDFTISYAYIDTDYRNRAEPSEILASLKALQHVESK